MTRAELDDLAVQDAGAPLSGLAAARQHLLELRACRFVGSRGRPRNLGGAGQRSSSIQADKLDQ
ncbi:hypothetical protein [Streptomyces sp. NPDC005345]|uniref:hypothetical protein n=1 Tax=Streptomyces sp. NPDC005345 TaxID=3156877 RepID=UPI0033A58CDE